MIGGWKRALVLAPHTDDGEFGCGGTMARLVDAGAEVRYVAFSIATEGMRAFKRTTILGYEIPWNNLDFEYQAYVALEQGHIERKTAALAQYASQQHRRYADPEYVWSLARTHGTNVNRKFAEVFQVYRAIF